MVSSSFVNLNVVPLVLLAGFVVASNEPSFGNDIADARKYLEFRHGNRSDVLPTSRDHRAVRGDGHGARQKENVSEPHSPHLSHRSCSPFMFMCDNGQCISKGFRCDGNPDCDDGSDEKCPRMKSSICQGNDFECKSGECISRLWVCDGENDCKDESDERGCECPYRCHSGKCVDASTLCDGEKDCEDGEDEYHCEKSRCSGVTGFYQCDTGDCVSPSKVCDNVTDCKDGTDEGPDCASSCKASNCTESCYETPKGPRCSCRDGFTFQDDLNTCTDENECEQRHVLVCDHFCKNTNGGFSCSCHENYALQEDGVTCKFKRPGDAFLLVGQLGSVRQLFLDRSRFIQIYSEENTSFVGLAYDPVTKDVFWGTQGRIMAAPLKEDSLPRTVLDKGAMMPEGLCVDWEARNLYIADTQMSHILVCKLDRAACYQLLTGLGQPRAIQLDIEQRYMYWTDVMHKSISKAGMDGSRRKVLVQNGLVWPNGLAIDLPADRLYWFDAYIDEAHTVRLDGSDRKTLHLGSLKHPYSLALWEDRLYWTDWSQSHISSCLKRNGKDVKIELKETHKKLYFGTLVFHPGLVETVSSPCTYAQCSHLCLLSPLSPGYTCACPSEVMQLDQDNRTCIDVPGRVFMIVTTLKKMYLVSPQPFGPSDQRQWMSNLELFIGDVEYYPGPDLAIVSDKYKAKIYSIDIETYTATILLHNTVAHRLALDWLRHNLYWLDSDKVQVMSLVVGTGSRRMSIIANLSAPLDIAVDPLAGLLFVSSASSPQTQASIKQCWLDGSNCYTLIDTKIHMPVSLAVSHKHSHLYWCDSFLGRIERINFSGTKRILIHSVHSAVMSLLIHGDSLSWTVENQPTIYTIRTNRFPVKDLEETKLTLDPREPMTLRLARVKRELPSDIPPADQRPCYNNGGCSEICVGNPIHKEVCLCGFLSTRGREGKPCESENDLGSVTVMCNKHQFQCADASHCIPISWKCDGSEECTDGSDEAGCPVSCQQNHTCGTTENCNKDSNLCNDTRGNGTRNNNGRDCAVGPDGRNSCQCSDHLCDTNKCLPKIMLCDGHVDCADESDESNCTHVACPTGKVKCRNGECVPKSWVCDGNKDCHDGSDEENCTGACPTAQYPCDKKCIAINRTCDGKKDCQDGKDELEWMCKAREANVCPESKIACLLDAPTADVVCFGTAEQCNGVSDCPYGDDECHYLCSHCRASEFRCPIGNFCIPLRFLCDGKPDCEDRADEVNCSAGITVTTTTQTTVSQAEQQDCGNVSCSQLCASGGNGCFCSERDGKFSSGSTKCKLTACDNHHCEGGNTCEAPTAEDYVCRCPEGRYMMRCQLGESVNENSNAAITTVVVVVLAVVVLLLVVLYKWKRCPFTIWKRRACGGGEQGYHFVNPAFGVMHDQPIIEVEANEKGTSAYPRPPQYRPPPYAPPPRSSSLMQNMVDSPTNLEDCQSRTSADSGVAITTDHGSFSAVGQPFNTIVLTHDHAGE